jgi:hypothetical protein
LILMVLASGQSRSSRLMNRTWKILATQVQVSPHFLGDQKSR